MKKQDKRRMITGIITIGIILIFMVVISAYSAELRCENNALISSNDTLKGEIETLSIKIKSANNIDNIEKVATGELGMIYPENGECVYITEHDAPKGNFAAVIRENAYN